MWQKMLQAGGSGGSGDSVPKEMIFMSALSDKAYSFLFANGIYKNYKSGPFPITEGDYIKNSYQNSSNQWTFTAVQKGKFHIVNNNVDLGVVEKNADEIIYSRIPFKGTFNSSDAITIWVE